MWRGRCLLLFMGETRLSASEGVPFWLLLTVNPDVTGNLTYYPSKAIWKSYSQQADKGIVLITLTILATMKLEGEPSAGSQKGAIQYTIFPSVTLVEIGSRHFFHIRWNHDAIQMTALCWEICLGMGGNVSAISGSKSFQVGLSSVRSGGGRRMDYWKGRPTSTSELSNEYVTRGGSCWGGYFSSK